MSSKFFKSTKDDKRLDQKVPNPMFSYNIATDFHQIVSLSSHFFTISEDNNLNIKTFRRKCLFTILSRMPMGN